jgi:hypothetical protein
MKKELIAPCGMNCGICIAFLRERNPCPGCRMIDTKTAKTRLHCIVRDCNILKDNNWMHCSDRCNEYPCKRLKSLDKRYRTKYHMSMLENLAMIKNQGMNAFLAGQERKWTCPTCGSTICCHNGLCYNCQYDEVKVRKSRLGWATDSKKQEKKK